jgi:hypothetical protein
VLWGALFCLASGCCGVFCGAAACASSVIVPGLSGSCAAAVVIRKEHADTTATQKTSPDGAVLLDLTGLPFRPEKYI